MTLRDPGYAPPTGLPGATYSDPTRPSDGADSPLPDKKTLEALTQAVTQELLASESSRREHMARVTDAWTAHDMTPYTADEMILPEMEGMRVPLIFSRVAQAHGSLYGALAVRPFFKADVSEGQDGTVAMHAEAAIDEELERAEFENAIDGALRGSLVGTCGFIKVLMNEDPDEPGEYRLDVEAVDIRELYLSPHEVRNLEQCNLIAHRYKTETWGWVWDNALQGVFDKEAAKKVAVTATGDFFDGGGTERVQLGLENARSGSVPDDSRQVDMVEAYIRFRPDPDSPREWWRVHLEYTSKVILRAEKWGDDQPFTAIRHQRGNTTMYAPSFANILQDMQWASDMLMSASIEADKMGVSPVWKVNVLSPAMEYLRKRQAENGGHPVRPLPGDIVPTRGGENELQPMYFQPTPPQIDARLNRIEQYANLSTITIQPMSTYRSATEHRYAMEGVSSKEKQMLKVLRADLARLGEKIKRLYWKYRSVPLTEDTRQVIHGTIAYNTTSQQWAMLRLTPRGMTTSADQMLTMQATQEAIGLQMQFLPQRSTMMQAGIWAEMYHGLDARLEALGIQDRVKYIGPNPNKDPNETQLDPIVAQQQQQASMLLMQMQAGQMPQQGQQGGPQGLPGMDGGSVRASDGAPTVPPGGAMMPGSVN